MADFIYVTGETMYAKVQPHQLDKKFNNWSVDFAPDKESRKVMDKAGLELKVRKPKVVTDENRAYTKKDYFRIRRDSQKLYKATGEVQKYGPPVVVIATGEVKDGVPVTKPYTGLIGNGSVVTLKIETYPAGARVGHRLHAVRIDKLVEYKVDPNKPREAKVAAEPSLDMPF